jgi:hypothetical protein
MRHTHSSGRQEPSVATATHPLVAVGLAPQRAGAGNHAADSQAARNACDLRAATGSASVNDALSTQRNRCRGARLIPFREARSYYGERPALTSRWRLLRLAYQEGP